MGRFTSCPGPRRCKAAHRIGSKVREKKCCSELGFGGLRGMTQPAPSNPTRNGRLAAESRADRRAVRSRAHELGSSIDATPQPLTGSMVMRAQDVAAMLNVPVSTVHEWARTGQLPSRKRGRHRLFIRAEIERWLIAAD